MKGSVSFYCDARPCFEKETIFYSQVYVEPLSKSDLLFITGALYPRIDASVVDKMVTFNMKVQSVCSAIYVWQIPYNSLRSLCFSETTLNF